MPDNKPVSIDERVREKLLLRTSVKFLLDSQGIDKSPHLQAEIVRLFGFDYKNPPFAYPYSQYLQIIEYIRTQLYQYKDPEAAYEDIGYRAIGQYLEGLAGPILKTAARVMGPERGSKEFINSLKKTLPWGSHEIIEMRPNHIAYRIRNVAGPPALMRGIIRLSLELNGVKITRISSTKLAEEDFIHEAEWS